MLSSFINLEKLLINRTQISEIPSYAFRPIIGIQSKLSYISLEGNKIEKIGNYSFYELKNLTFLSFTGNPVKLISMNSFDFKNFSNQTFELDFNIISTLDNSSFAINSFSNIKRRTLIHFGSVPNLKYFDETIFLPFFESNPENNIHLEYAGKYRTNLDCDDCRSYWLVKESKYLERFGTIYCLNGNNIRNSSNFKNCK
jgi:hypothetical protein